MVIGCQVKSGMIWVPDKYKHMVPLVSAPVYICKADLLLIPIYTIINYSNDFALRIPMSLLWRIPDSNRKHLSGWNDFHVACVGYFRTRLTVHLRAPPPSLFLHSYSDKRLLFTDEKAESGESVTSVIKKNSLLKFEGNKFCKQISAILNCLLSLHTVFIRGSLTWWRHLLIIWMYSEF